MEIVPASCSSPPPFIYVRFGSRYRGTRCHRRANWLHLDHVPVVVFLPHCSLNCSLIYSRKKNFMGSDRLLMFPHQVSLITLGEHSVAKLTSSVYLRVKKAETIRSGSLVLVDVNLCATDCPVASACY